MTNLVQAIAKKFNLDPNGFFDGWYAINCPFHNDNNPSAALNFESKMFNCLAGCGAMPFWKLAKDLKLDFIEREWDENFQETLNDFITNTTPSRPMVLRKQVEAYSNFLIERKLKPETIEELGGYYEANEGSGDYGFLIFKYGKTKTVKRRIIGVGERFIQSTRSGEGKDLFGRNLDSYDTIILVEGITDYCTLWQEQYTNFASGFGTKPVGIAASFGAKVSKQQMYLLRNKTVFILFDRDYEGFIGAKKTAEILREFDAIPIILEIPERFSSENIYKIDPNSAYCVDPQGFINWLNESIRKYSIYDTDYITNSFLWKDNPANIFKQISTGLHAFDKFLNGGFSTGIHGIAGPTSSGKSSLVTHFEDGFISQGFKVLSLSYELTKEQKYSRLASIISTEYTWPEIEKDHNILSRTVTEYLEGISETLRIENDWTIDEIIAASKNFDVIIIDYIQRMPFDGNDEMQGIKNNFYKLNNLAIKGKIVILMSSMPEAGTTIFKGTNVLKYGFASGWILTRIDSNLCSLECIKNTRGSIGIDYIDIDYGHQRIKDTVPPSLERIMG